MEYKYGLDNKGSPVITNGKEYCVFSSIEKDDTQELIHAAWRFFHKTDDEDISHLGIDKITDWKPLPSEKDLEN